MRNKQVNIRLSEEEYRDVKATAEARGITVTQLLLEAVYKPRELRFARSAR